MFHVACLLTDNKCDRTAVARPSTTSGAGSWDVMHNRCGGATFVSMIDEQSTQRRRN